MIGKTTTGRIVIITAIVAGAALALAALIGLATTGFRWDRMGGAADTVDERTTLPLTGIDLVSIDVVSEDVRIVEGTGDALEAWLHGTATVSAPENRPRLTSEQSGSTLVLRQYAERTIGFGFYRSRLVLEISVPRGYAGKLSVKTVSGDVQVADHGYAELAVATTSGDAHVGSVDVQDFSLRTTSGDLTVDSAAAKRSEISTVSGDVHVSLRSGDASFHTTSGDVTAVFGAVPGRIDSGSTSGRVLLRFPVDAQFSLDAHSTSGDITCVFPITIAATSSGGGRHALAGVVGAVTAGTGSGIVAVRTVSGDIRIEK